MIDIAATGDWLRRTGSRSDARLARVTSDLVVAALTLQTVLAAATYIDYPWPLPVQVAHVVSLLVYTVVYVRLERLLLAGRSSRRLRLAVTAMCVVAMVVLLLGSWPQTILASVLVAETAASRAWRRAHHLGLLAAWFVCLCATGARWIDVVAVSCISAVTAVGVYVLGRLKVTVDELVVTREQVARLKVDEERHRMSRDLHDILGRSLVAVSLRLQTTERLLDRDPEKARAQLAEAISTVDRAQTGLRHLSRGATVVDLADEAAAATELFDRLGIRSEVRIDTAAPHPDVEGVLARALRESVTNMLKHARPRTASVSLRRDGGEVVLEVLNDGAPTQPAPTRGTGLADLTERVRDIGGSLTAGARSDGEFVVSVRAPSPAPTSTEEASHG